MCVQGHSISASRQAASRWGRTPVSTLCDGRGGGEEKGGVGGGIMHTCILYAALTLRVFAVLL